MKIKLRNLSTSLMQLLSQDRARFEQQAGCEASYDWPNQDFQEALPFLLAQHAQHPQLSDWSFLIVSADTHQIVGEIGAKRPPDQDGAIEVGYGVAASQRRRGFATEALRAFLGVVFAAPQVRWVLAECLVENHGSIAVLERLGFTRTGEVDSDEGRLFTWQRRRG